MLPTISPFGMRERTRPFSRNHRVLRAGTSLIEVVVSVLLTSMVIVGALNSMAMLHRKDSSVEIDSQLRYQAGLLLEEITHLAYEDPDSTTESPFPLGQDAEESSTDRTTWDDIDDAHGWRCDPLTNRDGRTKLSLPFNLKASASVQWVDPVTLKPSSTESGLKEIKIVVASKDTTKLPVTAISYVSRNSFKANERSGVEVTVTTENGEELRFFVNPVNGATYPQDFSL